MKRSVVISMFVLCACLAAAQDVTKIGSITADVPVEKPVTTKAPTKTTPMDEVTVAEVARATRKVAKGEFLTARQVQVKIKRALARTSKTSPNYKWLSQLERELKDAINNYNAEKLANAKLVKRYNWLFKEHGRRIHLLEDADVSANNKLNDHEDRIKKLENRPAETERVIEKTMQSQWPLWLSIAALVVALTAIGLGLVGKIKLPTWPRSAQEPPADNRKAWEAGSLAEAWERYKTLYPVEAQAVQNGDPTAIPGFNDFLTRQYANIPDDIFGQPLKDVIDANPV